MRDSPSDCGTCAHCYIHAVLFAAIYGYIRITAGMRGCTGATKEMIYGTFFPVRFKTTGVKLKDGLDIEISVKIRSRD